MEIFFTKEQKWLDAWDVFLQDSERGLYNQLSDWVKSYQVYGFDFEFLIATENSKVVGGCGIIIVKFFGFIFHIVPSGPVVLEGYEFLVDILILNLTKKAVSEKSCYLQITVPLCKDNLSFNNYAIEKLPNDSIYFSGQEGIKFKYVIPLLGMRLVDLRNVSQYQSVLENYNSNNKRNLKKTKNIGLEFRFITSDIELKEAYNCFVLNAKEKGYPIRTYDSIAGTLRTYIDKDYAKVACCIFENKIIGALYVMKCGKRLTYINGGVLKDYQHLNISNYMHDQLIQYSILHGYISYDLSVGGNDGVIRFKESFGSKLYLYESTRYWILKPFFYNVYIILEKYIKPYKSQVANILYKLKKFRGKFLTKKEV